MQVSFGFLTCTFLVVLLMVLLMVLFEVFLTLCFMYPPLLGNTSLGTLPWAHFFGHTFLGTFQENNGLCHCINPTHVSANEHERFSTVENVRVSKETGRNVP
jgi:hypothetical protein